MQFLCDVICFEKSMKSMAICHGRNALKKKHEKHGNLPWEKCMAICHQPWGKNIDFFQYFFPQPHGKLPWVPPKCRVYINTRCSLISFNSPLANMAGKLPSAVTNELKSGGWSFEKANKGHFVFVREINGIIQRVTIAGSPSAKGHGGGHIILSQLRKHNERANWAKAEKGKKNNLA
jgi:hypothetical protein